MSFQQPSPNNNRVTKKTEKVLDTHPKISQPSLSITIDLPKTSSLQQREISNNSSSSLLNQSPTTSPRIIVQFDGRDSPINSQEYPSQSVHSASSTSSATTPSPRLSNNNQELQLSGSFNSNTSSSGSSNGVFNSKPIQSFATLNNFGGDGSNVHRVGSNSSSDSSMDGGSGQFVNVGGILLPGSFSVFQNTSPRISDMDPIFGSNAANIPLEDEERLSASSIGKRDLNELLSKSAPNLTSALSATPLFSVFSEDNFDSLNFGGEEEESIFSNTSMLLSMGQKVSSPAISKQTPKKKTTPESSKFEIQPLHNVTNNQLTPNSLNQRRRLSHQYETTPTKTTEDSLSLTPLITTGQPSPASDDKIIDEFLDGGSNNRRKTRSKSTITTGKSGVPASLASHQIIHQMSPITPTKLAIIRNATNSSLKQNLPPYLQSSITPSASPGGISVETVDTNGADSPGSLSTTFHMDPQTKDSITQNLKRKYSRSGSRSRFSKSAVDEHRLSTSLETIGIVLEHRSSTNNLLAKSSMKGSDLLQAVLQLQQEKKKTPIPEKVIEEREITELEKKKAILRNEIKGMDKMQCNQRMYQACKESDMVSSSLIIEEFITNLDINFKNTQDMEKGFLHLCARENNTELMELLLDRNADPNMKDKVSRTPLHVACSSGAHFSMVLLLGHDASPNVRDEYGFSPLGLALKQHYFDMAKDLLLFGADVNLKLYDGSTILHDFFGNGDMEVVKFLITDLPDSHSLLTMVRNEHGWSALFCAIQNSQIDVIRYLLTSKYQTQIFNSLSNSSNSGENVFHIVSKTGDLDMLSELINIFNERESQEHKMLLKQTTSNIPNYQKNIVSQRIQTLLNYQDNMRKMTPLHIAAKTKKAVMVRELMRLTTFSNTSGEIIDKKKKLYRAIDINIQDKKGNTPLHYCFFEVKDRELSNSEKAMITFLTSSKACKTDIKNEKGLTVKAICKKYGISLKDYI